MAHIHRVPTDLTSPTRMDMMDTTTATMHYPKMVADGTTMDHSHHHHTSPPDTMDHSLHGGGHDGHGGMMMYFHGGYDVTVLFEFWKVSNVTDLVFSMVGLFLVAALYEGLKVLREYLLLRSKVAEAEYSNVAGNKGVNGVGTGHVGEGESKEAATQDLAVTMSPGGSRSRMFSSGHFLQTFLHMVQVLISYLLMLVFMTYNSWLCLAVVLGAGAGYFAFGWKKAIVSDSNEHCN